MFLKNGPKAATKNKKISGYNQKRMLNHHLMDQILYFRNIRNDKIFFSFDGDTLINPLGKEVEYQEDLYLEVDSEELTLNQLLAIESRRLEEIRQIEREKIKYGELKVAFGDLHKHFLGKIAIVQAFGREYFTVSLQEHGPKQSNKDKVEQEVKRRLSFRKRKSTTYCIYHPEEFWNLEGDMRDFRRKRRRVTKTKESEKYKSGGVLSLVSED